MMGLNTDAFRACVESGRFEAEAKADMADGKKHEITGTPEFWVINRNGEGEKIAGAQPFESFQKVIEKYLKQLH